MSIKAVRISVEGSVQGVGFRNALYEVAKTAGLKGWVRNRADATVEATAIGSEMELQKLIRWCETGPPMAKVAKVLVTEIQDIPVYSSFTKL